MLLWLSLTALLCWSGSDLFSKIGCRDGSDRYSHHLLFPIRQDTGQGCREGIISQEIKPSCGHCLRDGYNEIRTMNRWNFRMTVCIKNTSAKNFGYKS